MKAQRHLRYGLKAFLAIDLNRNDDGLGGAKGSTDPGSVRTYMDANN